MLGAVWGAVLTTARDAARGVVDAASQAAARGLEQVRTAAGDAVITTGGGVGAAIAPSGTAPRAAGVAVANRELVLVGLAIVFLLLIGRH